MPPHRAARRTRKSWTNRKYGFRTKAKALTAFCCQVARAPPSGASVWQKWAGRAFCSISEGLGCGLTERRGVVGSASWKGHGPAGPASNSRCDLEQVKFLDLFSHT